MSLCQFLPSFHLRYLDDVFAIGYQQPVAFEPNQPLDQQLCWMMRRSAMSKADSCTAS